MPRQSSREKVARHRLRQALQEFSPAAEWEGVAPLPTCPDCGRTVVSTRSLPLCDRCWRRSPAGKVADAERKRRRRLRDDL